MHRTFRSLLRPAELAVALTVASGLAAAIAEGHARTREPSAIAAVLVERAACAGPAPVAAHTGGPGMRVAVPPTALLRVGWEGEVLAALTNTGCAPRPTDDIFYVLPDGAFEQAPWAELGHRRWIGDFTTSGVYVTQQPPT